MRLNEMAMPLAAAKQKVLDLSYEYAEHVMKCVVFRNTTRDLFHWEQEISNIISQVNMITVKPHSRKLDSDYYRDYFFLGQGDEVTDIDLFFSLWKKKEGKYYLNFAVTKGLCTQLLETFVDFADYFSPLLARKNNLSKTYFLGKIVDYFEE